MSSMKIELSKFSGFDSSLDICTFQNEFENLFSSKLRKSDLPDFLKWNYFEGQALILVRYGDSEI